MAYTHVLLLLLSSVFCGHFAHIPTALMINPFGDLKALRIHASLSTSKLLALPWMKSTKFSIHPWKYTSAIALTSLLFQKLREFCALKSSKISWPFAPVPPSFPPPARTLSSSVPKTTASEAAESWTSRCWWDILKPFYGLRRLSKSKRTR